MPSCRKLCVKLFLKIIGAFFCTVGQQAVVMREGTWFTSWSHADNVASGLEAGHLSHTSYIHYEQDHNFQCVYLGLKSIMEMIKQINM